MQELMVVLQRLEWTSLEHVIHVNANANSRGCANVPYSLCVFAAILSGTTQVAASESCECL